MAAKFTGTVTGRNERLGMGNQKSTVIDVSLDAGNGLHLGSVSLTITDPQLLKGLAVGDAVQLVIGEK